MLLSDVPHPVVMVQQAAEAALLGRAGCLVIRARDSGRIAAIAGQGHAGAAHALGSLAKIPAVLALARDPGALSWTCDGPKGKPPCWTRHGRLDTKGLLAESCSAAAARLGEQAGKPRLLASLKQCGFGRATGSGLDAEETGHLPADAPAGLLASGRAWNLTATPLQVAGMMMALAAQDSGVRGEPMRSVLDGLRLGVRRGTASGLDGAGYLAGKTGTASDGRGGRDGWFAGWTRRWVVVAWVQGGTGYETARSVAGILGRKLGSGS